MHINMLCYMCMCGFTDALDPPTISNTNMYLLTGGMEVGPPHSIKPVCVFINRWDGGTQVGPSHPIKTVHLYVGGTQVGPSHPIFCGVGPSHPVCDL